MTDDERDGNDDDSDSGEPRQGATRHGRRHHRGYGAWSWPTWAWPGNGDRQAALQERIFREHQRQLDDFSKQVSSGAYTAQSLVSEMWTFWARVLGDQADMVRTAYGMSQRSGPRRDKGPRVFAFSMSEGDETQTFTLRLDRDLLPDEDAALSVTTLRSLDYNWQVLPEQVKFKPAKVKRGPRSEIAVDITFVQVGRGGNQHGPGTWLGKLFAGDRPLGLLLLQIQGRSANLDEL